MATTRTMTVEELLELEDDGRRYELIRGELLSMPPTGEAHGHVMGKLSHLIWRYLDENPIALLAVGDPGYVLGHDPDILLAPDLALTLVTRLHGESAERGYPARAPDVVIEILSPTDRIGPVNEKVSLYLEAGVRIIWLIDPDRKAITQYAPNQPARLLQSGDTLTAESVLPGFQLPVSDIFA